MGKETVSSVVQIEELKCCKSLPGIMLSGDDGAGVVMSAKWQDLFSFSLGVLDVSAKTSVRSSARPLEDDWEKSEPLSFRLPLLPSSFVSPGWALCAAWLVVPDGMSWRSTSLALSETMGCSLTDTCQVSADEFGDVFISVVFSRLGSDKTRFVRLFVSHVVVNAT